MIQYPIFENDNVAGEATVQKEGLYCRLHCHFIVNNPESLRLICCGEKTSLNLGRGVPNGSSWEVKRFFSLRDLPSGELKFLLKAGTTRQKLIPGEPVDQISQLVKGKLYCCEDGYWVVDASGE